MKEQISDLAFRTKFLVQLCKGTQIDFAHHRINSTYSDNHLKCYKAKGRFMANLTQSLEYTMEAQMAMESALWEHRILIEFHQNAHNLLKEYKG